jgi:hypothetical protein
MSTRTPEMIEGPEAWTRFTAAMKGVLSVPKEVVQAKIEEHRKESLTNPNRRGPKRKKSKSSASRAPRA